MNLEANKRLHFYIGQALREGGETIADAYDAIDTSDVHISTRLDRIVYRVIRRDEFFHANRRVIRITKRVLMCAVIAVMLVVMLVFTIAAARGTILNAIVEWYDDYILIHFDNQGVKPDSEGMESIHPKYILETRAPSVLPGEGNLISDGGDWVFMPSTPNKFFYTRKDFSYRQVSNYDWNTKVFTFSQAVWSVDLYPLDMQEYEVEKVTINQDEADALFALEGDRIILIWKDEHYRYCIQSTTFSLDELIRIAESVSPNYSISDMQEEIEVRIPAEVPEGWRQEFYRGYDNLGTVKYFKDNRCVAAFYQNTKSEYSSIYWDVPLHVVPIGQTFGIVLEVPDDSIQLQWDDDTYTYTIWDHLGEMSLEELVTMAASVQQVNVAPSFLARFYKPQNLDSDITEKVWERSERRLEIDYYRGDERICVYTQMLLTDGIPTQGYGYTEEPIVIHHAQGVLRTYKKGKNVIIWNDENYRYRLESNILNAQELIEWAWNVVLPEEIVEVRKPDNSNRNITEYLLSETKTSVCLSYQSKEGTVYTFSQSVLFEENTQYDTGCEVWNVDIGTRPGVVLGYPDGRLILIWTDKSYRYELQSQQLSLQQLLEVAQSVKSVSQKEEDTELMPPVCESIEEVRKPWVYPDTLDEEIIEQNESEVIIQYKRGNKTVAQYSQGIMTWEAEQRLGICTVYHPKQIHGYTVHIFEFLEDGSDMMVWTDGSYFYTLRTFEQTWRSFETFLEDIS